MNFPTHPKSDANSSRSQNLHLSIHVSQWEKFQATKIVNQIIWKYFGNPFFNSAIQFPWKWKTDYRKKHLCIHSNDGYNFIVPVGCALILFSRTGTSCTTQRLFDKQFFPSLTAQFHIYFRRHRAWDFKFTKFVIISQRWQANRFILNFSSTHYRRNFLLLLLAEVNPIFGNSLRCGVRYITFTRKRRRLKLNRQKKWIICYLLLWSMCSTH